MTRLFLLAYIALLAITCGRTLADPPAATAPAATTQPVNPRANLNQPITELNLESTGTVERAINALREATHSNLVVNWEALQGWGIDRNKPLKLHLWNVTLGGALAAILDVSINKGTYGFAVQGDLIVIGTDEALPGVTEVQVYDVRDLIDSLFEYRRERPASRPAVQVDHLGPMDGAATREDAADAVAEAIETGVAPDTWKDNGGFATIRNFAGRLIIGQTPENHRRIAEFLRALRADPAPLHRATSQPAQALGASKNGVR